MTNAYTLHGVRRLSWDLSTFAQLGIVRLDLIGCRATIAMLTIAMLQCRSSRVQVLVPSPLGSTKSWFRR
jgi:hypothetical protein